MEIEKNLVVSTSHMTKNDSIILSDAKNLIVYKSEFWFLVNLPGIKEDGIEEDLSSELKELLCWAAQREGDFTFLKLDADGPVMEGFPTFEW